MVERQGGRASGEHGEGRREVERRRELNPRIAATIAVGLAGGIAAFMGERFLTEEKQIGELRDTGISEAEREKLLRQLKVIAETVKELPTNREHSDEEVEKSLDEMGFDDLDLSREALGDLPMPKPDHGPYDLDVMNWITVREGGLSNDYQALIDDLVIDVDEKSIHLYSPEDEAFNIVLTLESAIIKDEEVLLLSGTDGERQNFWTVNTLNQESVQTSVRRAVQSEIISYLVHELRTPASGDLLISVE